ncbi:Kinesin-like protein KIFC3 [Aphelenchoides bicaudatus]|nr:Kinesin-like protein KIFC3 [Aphelenchoides bicaudatus]
MATTAISFFEQCPRENLYERSVELDSKFTEKNLEDKDALISNLETIIDELETELEGLRAKYNIQPPVDHNDLSKKRVLKGISYLSLDFGRLSAENLELRQALKQSQLECRQLYEKWGKIQYKSLPITVDSTVQTELESVSGSTTPSIPSDPLMINEDLNLLAMRKELQMLSQENSSLKEFASEYKREMSETFDGLRSQLMSAIPGHFSKLLKRYQEEVELRRALHNVLIELRGNIRIFCRLKPGAPGPIVLDALDPDSVTVQADMPKHFLFDKVFGPETSQLDVFDEVSPLIQSCLDGKNVSFFAYGHTGSGKTHTVFGSKSDPGISYRAAHEIFYLMEAKQDCLECEVTCSIIEIYNEKIRDLLESQDTQSKIQIRMDADGRSEIRGIRRPTVCSVEDLQALIEVGQKNRSTAATALNACSSRSHALVMMALKIIDRDSGNEWTGRLNFVDLAGSERVAKSKVTGAQLQEAKFINKSLAELGNVVLALRRNQVHVPFRNCLLTRVLEDSLVGDSKTLMIIQLTNDLQSAQESLSSLNFAEKGLQHYQKTKSFGWRCKKSSKSIGLVSTLTSRCFDICFTDSRPPAKMDGKHSSCMANCVDRMLDASEFMVNHLQNTQLGGK